MIRREWLARRAIGYRLRPDREGAPGGPVRFPLVPNHLIETDGGVFLRAASTAPALPANAAGSPRRMAITGPLSPYSPEVRAATATQIFGDTALTSPRGAV